MTQYKARCIQILMLLACTALISVQGDDVEAPGGPPPGPPTGGSLDLGDLMIGAKDSHDCAGKVKILDEVTIEIAGLKYDGNGPGAYFVLSDKDSTAMMNGEKGNNIRPVVVTVEEGQKCEMKPGLFDGSKTVKFKLPKGKQVQNFKYFALFCMKVDNVFCHVKITPGLKPPMGTSTLEECKPEFFDGQGSGGRLVLPIGLILFSTLSVISFGRNP